MGVIKITSRRFSFSPGILATHNRDPAKDTRIPVSDQNDCLAEFFLLVLTFPVFSSVFKIVRHSINSEFSKLSSTNSEKSKFPFFIFIVVKMKNCKLNSLQEIFW